MKKLDSGPILLLFNNNTDLGNTYINSTDIKNTDTDNTNIDDTDLGNTNSYEPTNCTAMY